ncbi:hypothetical protein HNP84_007021 [Thermocatellispora tengchongensis]|uniref:Uncharacterized protein n=1 Tax=Thermocatellispora tengchongensis TaxID=1073253 RepID=A0A840PE56_9ACTN|nr:hypothetical protein [Thermocatellispora tengchongensis]MBB5137269.1 hypothetical protein [Thermocatellispora tengchongensis]
MAVMDPALMAVIVTIIGNVSMLVSVWLRSSPYKSGTKSGGVAPRSDHRACAKFLRRSVQNDADRAMNGRLQLVLQQLITPPRLPFQPAQPDQNQPRWEPL